uniref:G-protein coupled receptors family 1 profile domain-containing protein n=1 Tax=Ascaris lumbricoides TaxID=6252 RepID=A0A9J2Q536_ASCLU
MSDEEEAFQRSDDGDLKAPTLIATDYLEIAVLAVVLCIGVPLNAVVLRKLLRLYSTGVTLSRAKQDETRIGFLMLQIHLTIVDLIFIILYCPSKLIWLICYVWPFGAFLCKAVQYSWMFAHHSMSFAIVSIAIDRVKTVYDLMAMRERGRMAPPKSKIRCIKRMIVLTYLGAAIFSLPQWLAWTTADLVSWSQCTTIWHKQRAIDFLNGNEYTVRLN